VRLTVDGHSESQTLTVKMDPRIQTAPSDLEALHTAQMTMADSLDTVAKADLAAHAVAEQIAAPRNASLSSQLAPYSDALKALLSGNPAKHTPGIDEVNGEVGQLYGGLEQADGVPTEALLAAAAHARDEVKEVLPGWDDFRENQLPALNKVLEAAHHARINLAKPPDDMPDEGDED
jgi:flagellar hook-length control protein FliK